MSDIIAVLRIEVSIYVDICGLSLINKTFFSSGSDFVLQRYVSN